MIFKNRKKFISEKLNKPDYENMRIEGMKKDIANCVNYLCTTMREVYIDDKKRTSEAIEILVQCYIKLKEGEDNGRK